MAERAVDLDESGSLWISSSVEVLKRECNGNDLIRSVRFSPDCRLRMIGNAAFSCCSNLSSVHIPPSVESIESMAFGRCTALTEVIFAANSRLRLVNGFEGCSSLSRLEIPASVEVIASLAFDGCKELAEVVFPANSRLRWLDGFREYISLRRLEIPASVEEIGWIGWAKLCEMVFLHGVRQPELIFASGTRIERLSGYLDFRGFITFADKEDVKKRRRRVHLTQT
jgi:hypothetical protein